MVSVPFPIGKLGVAPAGCMSDIPEMECVRSEMEELIKEVRRGGLRHLPGRNGH